MLAFVLGSSGRVTAAVLVFAVLWTVPVLRRLPEDLALVRGRAERPEKVAVVAVWGLTVLLVGASLAMVVNDAAGYARWIP